ncbi:MAG TPA: glycosyltransferase family 1 protein [Acidimicrobiia bacterium]|nr:glycosyltransferase family 1 protein [Acidimicrobiia bacterium]
MRVALQAGQLDQPVPGGIGRYVEGLFRHLPEAGVAVERFGGGRWLYEAWHRFRRPVVRTPGDLVHAPSLAVPPAGRRPLVVTVHDLAFRTHPECFPARGRSFHERGLALARAEAAAVIVPSEATAAELRAAGFDAGRIHVAHHGIDRAPLTSPEPPEPGPGGPGVAPGGNFPAPSMNPLQAMHPHWQPAEGSLGAAAGAGGPTPVLGLEPRSYVLFVGTVEPRKGIDVLLAAHAALRRGRHPELRLVVAGPPGWGQTPALDGPGVVAPGRVDELTLDALYRGAAALAVPSRSEGFGLPALEAMARGCPVVASDAGALPEVMAGAGVLVPPGDADALAAALDNVLTDDALAASLGAAGHRRAGTFTWQACTAAHIAAYRAALGLPAPPPPDEPPPAAPPPAGDGPAGTPS